MKKLLLFLLLLPGLVSAQWQTAIAPTGTYTSAPLAWYVPAGYADSTLPVIFFFHGGGEAGTNINRVLNSYLPRRIRDGWVPQAVNPQTGKLEKFIVIAAQEKQGTPWPVTMRYQFQWLIKEKGLNPDTSRIYATGLSFGGAGSVLFATWDTLYPKVKAVASLSPMADVFYRKSTFNLTAPGGADMWFYTGNQDAATNVSRQFETLWRAAGGSVKVDVFNGGHDASAWNAVYWGNVKIAHEGKQLNMYEWFLAHGQPTGTVPNTPEPPGDTLKYIQIFHDPAKVQKVIILDKDGTWTEHNDSSIVSGQIKLIVQ